METVLKMVLRPQTVNDLVKECSSSFSILTIGNTPTSHILEIFFQM